MQNLISRLVIRNNSKIVLVVLDGLGGVPGKDGRTELEAAPTPNLDALAARSACGLHVPVAMGITPGSGPGHLGLFGYDPNTYQIGRGILEALGLGMEVRETDIALRCNYCTLDGEGLVADRRARRIPTAESSELTALLAREITEIDDVEIIFAKGMEHRFAVLLRFPETLNVGADTLGDTDPQQTGVRPLELSPGSPEAKRTAKVAKRLLIRVAEVLGDREYANNILLRGFSKKPKMPTFLEAYGLKALAIAAYPMYRGVAKLVGMEAPELTGDLAEEMALLKSSYNDYDYFFFHVKKTDSYGEDGNFEAKAAKIAEFDRLLPEIMGLSPDVLIITADHCTPAIMKRHSWHPVPVLLSSPYVLGQMTGAFTERECYRGELGVFPTANLMSIAMANALRLKKFGA